VQRRFVNNYYANTHLRKLNMVHIMQQVSISQKSLSGQSNSYKTKQEYIIVFFV